VPLENSILPERRVADTPFDCSYGRLPQLKILRGVRCASIIRPAGQLRAAGIRSCRQQSAGAFAVPQLAEQETSRCVAPRGLEHCPRQPSLLARAGRRRLGQPPAAVPTAYASYSLTIEASPITRPRFAGHRQPGNTGEDRRDNAIMFRSPAQPVSARGRLEFFLNHNKLNLTWIEFLPAKSPAKAEYVFVSPLSKATPRDPPHVNALLPPSKRSSGEELTILGSLSHGNCRG